MLKENKLAARKYRDIFNFGFGERYQVTLSHKYSEMFHSEISSIYMFRKYLKNRDI